MALTWSFVFEVCIIGTYTFHVSHGQKLLGDERAAAPVLNDTGEESALSDESLSRKIMDEEDIQAHLNAHSGGLTTWGRRRRRRRRCRRRRWRRRIPVHMRPDVVFAWVMRDRNKNHNMRKKLFKMKKHSRDGLIKGRKAIARLEKRYLRDIKKGLRLNLMLTKTEYKRFRKVKRKLADILIRSRLRVQDASKVSRLTISVAKAVRREQQMATEAAIKSEKIIKEALGVATKADCQAKAAIKYADLSNKINNVVTKEAVTTKREVGAANKKSSQTQKMSKEFSVVIQSALDEARAVIAKTEGLKGTQTAQQKEAMRLTKGVVDITGGIKKSDSTQSKIRKVIDTLEAQDKLNKRMQSVFEQNQRQLRKQLSQVKQNIAKVNQGSEKADKVSKRLSNMAIKVEEQIDNVEDMDDRMKVHLEDTADLAIGNENAREQLQEMQDTMEDTMEALAALSTGLEKQQVKMETRKVQIDKQNKDIDAHQKKILKASSRLQKHQGVINKAAKDNQIQSLKIRANVETLIKHEKVIKNIAQDQAEQAAMMAKHGLSDATNAENSLAKDQKGAVSSSKKMVGEHAKESKGIDHESEKATTMETKQRVLMTEAKEETAEIASEEKQIAEDEATVNEVHDGLSKTLKLYLFIMLGIVFALFGVVSVSIVRWRKINTEVDQLKSAHLAAIQQAQEETYYAEETYEET
eukprot:gnl/MRDRNA2_/MRDRNA2_103050_c0_seq1.p1 gnl/MRDRNA2_/MRDRNA2_103050_c0~~gnl/MRDRNA2_/MRDRNA2_103050_c0_seq1.p1  ORF type:complete len:694 (+),score=170.04 gnl/MRDRNA2_/MRDRNA2_103050_c0_seq1:61-2142(+)